MLIGSLRARKPLDATFALGMSEGWFAIRSSLTFRASEGWYWCGVMTKSVPRERGVVGIGA
jgi:hypothetical protein